MRRLWIALPLAALLCLPAGAVEARELTPLKYDKIDLFNGDVPTAEVTLNGKLGALDAEGREVVPARYDQVWRYDDTTWTVALGDRWGTAGEGRELVPQDRLRQGRQMGLSGRTGRRGHPAPV